MELCKALLYLVQEKCSQGGAAPAYNPLDDRLLLIKLKYLARPYFAYSLSLQDFSLHTLASGDQCDVHGCQHQYRLRKVKMAGQGNVFPSSPVKQQHIQCDSHLIVRGVELSKVTQIEGMDCFNGPLLAPGKKKQLIATFSSIGLQKQQ